jgi:hypothetical protein
MPSFQTLKTVRKQPGSRFIKYRGEILLKLKELFWTCETHKLVKPFAGLELRTQCQVTGYMN